MILIFTSCVYSTSLGLQPPRTFQHRACHLVMLIRNQKNALTVDRGGGLWKRPLSCSRPAAVEDDVDNDDCNDDDGNDDEEDIS